MHAPLFVLLLAAFVGMSLGCASGTRKGTPDQAPLNIVLLYADDWRHDTLGCAGNLVVQTPRLDALAAGGVRFTHNSVTTAICGVSRATMADLQTVEGVNEALARRIYDFFHGG